MTKKYLFLILILLILPCINAITDLSNTVSAINATINGSYVPYSGAVYNIDFNNKDITGSGNFSINDDIIAKDTQMSIYATNLYTSTLKLAEQPVFGLGLQYDSSANKMYVKRFNGDLVGSNIMTFERQTQNVGINTTTPDATLDVNGDVLVRNNFTAKGISYFGDGGCNLAQDNGDICANGVSAFNNTMFLWTDENGLGLVISESGSQDKIIINLDGDAYYNLTNKEFCDPNFTFNESLKYYSILVSFSNSGIYRNAGGEISGIINNTCVSIEPYYVPDGFSGFEDGIGYFIGEPGVLYVSRGTMKFNSGNFSGGGFSINNIYGTNDHTLLIRDEAGKDGHNVMKIESDVKNYTNIIINQQVITSSTGQNDSNNDLNDILLDLSNSNNSYYHINKVTVIESNINENKVGYLELSDGFDYIVEVGESLEFNKSYNNILGVNTDVTNDFKNALTDTVVFSNNGDFICIGNDKNFTNLGFSLATGSTGSVSPDFYYCNDVGTYTLFSATDLTNGFKNSGSISFINPIDRGVCNTDIDGTAFADTNDYTYICIERTAPGIGATDPEISLVTISSTEVDYMKLTDSYMKLKRLDDEPISCSNKNIGVFYWDTAEGFLCICDGTNYVAIDDRTSICS